MINQTYQAYRRITVGGITDGLTDFFAGVDLESLKGNGILIKNIEFVPRYKSTDSLKNEIMYKDATGAGNDMDLISPNAPVAVPPALVIGSRIISANVEFSGINLIFKINNVPIQLVEGTQKLLNFDSVFKDINIRFPVAVNQMYMTASEFIFTDVAIGTAGTYYLQVNMDIIVL